MAGVVGLVLGHGDGGVEVGLVRLLEEGGVDDDPYMLEVLRLVRVWIVVTPARVPRARFHIPSVPAGVERLLVEDQVEVLVFEVVLGLVAVVLLSGLVHDLGVRAVQDEDVLRVLAGRRPRPDQRPGIFVDPIPLEAAFV